MTRNTKAIVAVLAFLALPAILALADAAVFWARNRSNGVLVSSGETREYELYVPPAYSASRRVPLVISLHGAGGWPVQQMQISGWNRLAARENFIVAYPAGSGNFGPRIWHTGSGNAATRDVRFISDLIDKLERDYAIDRERIYINGLSNGGGESFVLACTMSERIAAVGMVSSAQMLSWSWCTDRRPVPMIAFHGTADRMAPYDGGRSWLAPVPFLPLPKFVAQWARRNGCAPNAIESRPARDVTRREYQRCADDATVVFYTLHGGGHVWPGGEPLPEWFAGADSRTIDATREMWTFFREHRRPLS
ncbi:MAG TPA: PHB depolymerase family esterase [Thermoanaerobaculia bacterium]|nr:PHB depolymerase family esterase [Thermoanaerobaculia bacterium]